MNRHEREQQRPPPAPPPRRQPWPRHRQHRGQHGDPPRVVEELRQQGVEAVVEVEVPPRRGDAVGVDRQRQHGDEPRRGVRAEQLPLPRSDQADQDRERQCQDRDAVDQVHQVGLGGVSTADDPRDRPLQRHPVLSGDQRTGDDGGEEDRREHQPEDVVGAPDERLQQAAGDGDLPPVDSHAPDLSIGPVPRGRRPGVNLSQPTATTWDCRARDYMWVPPSTRISVPVIQ